MAVKNALKKVSTIGVDRGVVHTLVVSDGLESEVYDLPKNVIDLEKRRSCLQSRLKNKKKFSNNWQKAQGKIRAINSKIGRIRLDFHHKVSTNLTKSHSQICLEDLRVKNMTKSAKGTLENPGKHVKQKQGLNRSILRQGWGQFERLIEYKAQWYGAEVIYVNPRNTSVLCNTCGYSSPLNRQSQSHFECKSCGKIENADINAAKNILTRGQRGRACGDVEGARIYEAGTSLTL